MRKIVAAIMVLQLCAGLISGCSRPEQQPEALRAAVVRDLSQPSSIWMQALRPETAAGDLARYKQAPVYRASLTYEPKTRELAGKEEILYTNTSDQTVAALNLETAALLWSDSAEPFTLSDLQVNGGPGTYKLDKDHVAVALAKPLAPGATVQLAFSFRAVLPVYRPKEVQLDTIYTSNPGTYGALDNQTHGLGEAIPMVMSDNTLWNLWDVSLDLPADWEVISSGVKAGPESTKGDRQTTRIVSASYSLFVFAAWGLESATRSVDGVKITVHYPGTAGSVGPEVLDEAAQLLPAHEAVLGPYPFRELEILPLPMTRSGKNRSGLVMIGRGYLSDEAQVPSGVTDPWLRGAILADKGVQGRRRVLAHELAHSWWGDLVWPPDPLRAPSWIEGMTEASAIAAMERVYGAAAAGAARDTEVYWYRRMREIGYPDVASGRPRAEGTSPGHYFEMSYYKPALFYDQVRLLVGDDAFFSAMRTYIARNRLTVTTDGGPITELLGDPQVSTLHQRWMLETHGDEDIGLLTADQIKLLRQFGFMR